MTDSMQYDLSKRDGIDSILIVRLKALGDIVLSLPIIGALRARFPNAWIGYLCWEQFAEALSGETGLDSSSLHDTVRNKNRMITGRHNDNTV